MSKDRIIMLATAFTSALCVVWAISITAFVMAALLALNAFFSLFVFAFKLKK